MNIVQQAHDSTPCWCKAQVRGVQNQSDWRVCRAGSQDTPVLCINNSSRCMFFLFQLL